MNEKEASENIILLDTNILQYLNNTQMQTEILGLLTQFESQDTTIAISQISVFELVSNVSKDKEQELVKTLEKFSRYPVTENTLLTAAQFSSLYSSHPQIKDHQNQISLCDKVISATAALAGAHILTADYNDFPRPFFDENYCHEIKYQHKQRRITQYLYILTPNTQRIVAAYENR